MILYSGQYRRPHDKKWHKLERVKGDHIYSAYIDREQSYKQLVSQIMITFEDERVLFLPITCEIEWTPQRFQAIKERMGQEAGQPMNLNKR